MPLVIDANAAAAYEDIRNDNTKSNWFTLEYAEDSNDHLKVGTKGNGGLAEFVRTSCKQDKACFGYIRMVVGNDELSQRAKFVFVSWAGGEVKIMRRGKMTGHILDVKKIVQNCAVDISASNVEDLSEKIVTGLLRKAMGALY